MKTSAIEPVVTLFERLHKRRDRIVDDFKDDHIVTNVKHFPDIGKRYIDTPASVLAAIAATKLDQERAHRRFFGMRKMRRHRISARRLV